MGRIMRFRSLLGLFALTASATAGPLLLLCDQTVPEISAWEIDGERPARRWAWVPGDDEGIPAERKSLFAHPTDAKPSHDGRHLIVSASGGGVALISVKDLRAVWHASPGGNPHSVAALPDGSFVVASSTGNRLTHYGADRQEIGRHTVQDAHGACWDPKNNRLLVLGSLNLHPFTLREGKLSAAAPIPLPVDLEAPNGPRDGGHDLAPLGDGSFLLSDAHHVWKFVPGEPPRFLLWRQLDQVKAVSPGEPGIVLVRATESWWSDEVRWLPANRVLSFPGARIYKARWWPESPAP